jgi:hypothetical protein
MQSSEEYYRKRVGKALTQTSTGTTRNSDLAAFSELLNPVLPDNVRVDDRNAGEITYTNGAGQGFTLRKDSRDRLACVFTRAIASSYAYNLELIEPESFARFSVNLFTSLTGWNMEFDTLKIRETKRKKKKSIAEKNIRIMVEEIMKDLNYEYSLVNQESKVLLNIRIAGKRKIEIPIRHKNFVSEVPLLVSTIERILELCSQTGFKIQIKNHGNNITWTKGGIHAC